MAGDWIKLEHAALDKPEVLRTAEMLSISRDAAIGLYLRFWVWLDKNLSANCPGSVRNMSRTSIDAIMTTPGFSACLVAVGWAEFDDSGHVMHITHAERHNGNTAKTRALDSKRKKVSRADPVRVLSAKRPVENGPEKRREYKPPKSPSRGFEVFWDAYPKHRRIAKAKCLKIWTANRLETIAGAITEHVTAMRSTDSWTKDAGQFVPQSMTYLNQQRWETAIEAEAQPMRLVV